ncbi:MAG TPA: HAMP domain-containing sensor histidine kinase [Vicinamibacteria bacterium]|nr:HAMP domain-containing sensor histidine kinase [Vicinamibacteria bacterium]
MLHEFLTVHRDEIIARTRQKVATRMAPRPTAAELEHGVPLFLEQLVDTLRREQGTPARPTSWEMGRSALRHGADLRTAGFTIAQVVHDYGDVCQAVTELSIELQAPISGDEFKTLNRCLDEAIAQAVTEFARQRDISVSEQETERLGLFAHELRNSLSNAMLAFEVLKTGTVGVAGSTGGVLGRNLIALRDLIDRSLAAVRLEAGFQRRQHVPLTELMEEVELAAAMEARAIGVQLTVTPVEPGLVIDVDRQLIAAALANLLQNAFKFGRRNGHVVLRTDSATTTGRVLIEVEDECGGLPPGRAEDLFRPFAQRGTDRTGLGLGLTIARDSVEVNGGEIRLRDLPGRGCIITIDLPLVAPVPVPDSGELVQARD